MTAEKLDKNNISLAREFLLPREYSCAGLCERLFNCAGDAPPSEYTDSAYLFFADGADAGRRLDGVCDATNYGTLFHSFGEPKAAGEYIAASGALKEFSRVCAIIGVREGTIAIERALTQNAGLKIQAAQDYYLLTLERGAARKTERAKKKEFFIREAREADIESLIPLRIAYEREEVCVQDRPAREELCRLQLSRMLKNQLFFVASMNGKIAATAATNARGVNWNQIGGVYTAPRWRNLGAASALTTALCNKIFENGQNAVLFVKEKNLAARRVYEKAGFAARGSFRITYLAAR